MKHWLTHLVLVILAVLFFDGTAKGNITVLEDVTEESSANVDACGAGLVAPVSEFCLPPRQVSSINSQRLQNTVKRIPHPQRYGGGIVKAGKASDTGIYRILSNKSFILYSSFVKPAHRLISFGKLII